MNDINQSPNQTGQEFEEYPDLPVSIVPDFNQMAADRVANLTAKGKEPKFDPHALMIKKKEIQSGELTEDTPSQKWPEEEVKALEEFCKQYGILGISCGKMPPAVALGMLKAKMGIVDGPLDKRIPAGYEKLGVKPMIYDQNYSYTTMLKKKAEKKTLLNG